MCFLIPFNTLEYCSNSQAAKIVFIIKRLYLWSCLVSLLLRLGLLKLLSLTLWLAVVLVLMLILMLLLMLMLVFEGVVIAGVDLELDEVLVEKGAGVLGEGHLSQVLA